MNSDPTHYLLAIDGGGTKTQVICSDVHGQIVGEGLAGPTNLTATNVGAASFNLREGIRQATQNLPQPWQIKKVVMGLAGLDTASEQKLAETTFSQIFAQFGITDFILVNDIVIALESGATKPNSVALIAGTGSNCFGHNAQNQTAKTGGMDYLLTDQGSGYAVGRAVLRASVKSFDGRGEKTILERMVCEYFKLSSIADLKAAVYNPPLTKTEIADIAKLALQGFEQNDAVARAILDHAVDELFGMVSTVVTKLSMTSIELDCVLVGGLFTFPYLKERLHDKLVSLCPAVTIITPEKPPVYGALKMVLQGIATPVVA